MLLGGIGVNDINMVRIGEHSHGAHVPFRPTLSVRREQFIVGLSVYNLLENNDTSKSSKQ